MTWTPFPLVGAAYNDESRPWSSQRLVNMLLVPAEAEGTRSRAKLTGVPGLDSFTRGMQEAPVRGLHNCEGMLLAVTGDTLYRVTPTGVCIPLGTVPGTGRVEMAHNQITNGYEVLVANNQSGYVYNTRTENFGQIDDAGFPGLRSPGYIDGYIAGVEPQGRFWAHSELRQATEWNTLDRYAAEARPDKIQLLRVNNRSVLVLGETSGQFFRNTGALTGTFANENGTEFAVGAASRYAAEVVDNNVVWLGNDGLVYTLNGASPTILSTGPIAQAMAQYNLGTCFTTLWEDRKHKVVYFTFPQGRTFGIDLWTRTWHERVSYGLDRWRINALVRWNGQWIAGDFYNGRLYKLDWRVQAEYDQPLVRRRVTAAIHADENEVIINALRIVANTGQPCAEPSPFPVPPVGPQISGEAPDGLTSDAYSFTYTVTQGTAPISRIVLRDTVLPSGWSWDDQTATISHDDTPVPEGSINLRMRVYDTNGLFDDHTDEFVIGKEAYLVVTGAAKDGSENPLFASAVALEPIEFSGIEQSTGADIASMTIAWADGTWCAVHATGARSAGTEIHSWTAGSVSEVEMPTFGQVAGNGAGWLAVIPNQNDIPTAYVAPADASLAFTRTALEATFTNGSDADTRIQTSPTVFSAGGKLYLGAARTLFQAEDPAGPWTTIWDSFKEIQAGRNPNGASIIGWYDLAEFEGHWYAVIEWHFDDAAKRYQIIRSENGVDSWSSFEVLVDRGRVETLRPAQFCVGGGELVCYTTDGQLWSSRDWSTPISTGIGGPGEGNPGVITLGGKRIVFANSRFYLIDATDKCVIYDPTTGEVGEPITLPIDNIVSIATDYMEPAGE